MLFAGGSVVGKGLFYGTTAVSGGQFIANPTKEKAVNLLTIPILFGIGHVGGKFIPFVSKGSKNYIPYEETGFKIVEGMSEKRSAGELLKYEGKKATMTHASYSNLRSGDIIKPSEMKYLSGWRKKLNQRSFYTSSPSKSAGASTTACPTTPSGGRGWMAPAC
jgi:hypothetical protein